MALVARGTAPLEQLASELGKGSIALSCDLTDEPGVRQMALTVTTAFNGAPDIVVNNAGIFAVAKLDAMSPAVFRNVLDTNLVAPFLVVREFIGAMRARGSGHFLTLGSVADRAVFPENGAYSPAKFALRAMHEVLRDELKGSGVRATLVSPGPVDTAMWNGISFGDDRAMPDRSTMLSANAVASAVLFAVTQSPAVNIDELRLSHA